MLGGGRGHEVLGYFVGDVEVAGQVDIAETTNHEEGVISSTVIGEFGSHHVHVFGRGR
jgi:hypothetical protein